MTVIHIAETIGTVIAVFVCFGCFILLKEAIFADTGESPFRKTITILRTIAYIVAWLILIPVGLFVFSALFWNPAVTLFLGIPVWIAGFYLSESY